jgi:hypothetical protein
MTRAGIEQSKPAAAPHDVIVTRNVVCAIHRHGPAEPALEAQLTGLQRASQTNPDGVGFLLILVDGAKTPDGDGRKRVMNAFAALGPRLRGVAIVMSGTGFWSSAVRSTVAVLLISIARGYEAKIFATTNEAADWLGSQVRDCKGAATVGEIRSVASDLATA